MSIGKPTAKTATRITMMAQQQAMKNYMDSLLGEIEEYIEEPVGPVVIPQIIEVVSVELVTEVAEEERNYPDWVGDEIQVLLFKVSGLTLGIPMKKLNGILEWNDNLTSMPGHSPWFLGVLSERDTNIKIIDTALIVVPERYRQSHSRGTLQKIILLGDSEWGLACDGLDEVITLAPEEVKWRTGEGKRAWLAGTVIDRKCALLDADAFADLLGSDELAMHV
ncbi:MAG: hypothetical protein BMS9Abin26_1230 [Gammaproteobacteria bacterium]|nr:MAG: hypothetical protein BMS9Abin26_1230 [Gammaproteobacteria bacterium]